MDNQTTTKTIHFFHCPSDRERIESFLAKIALPLGCKADFTYREKYIHKEIIEYYESGSDEKVDAIFWLLNKTPQFDFAYPIRLCTDVKITKTENKYNFSFINAGFVEIDKCLNLTNLSKYLGIDFNKDKSFQDDNKLCLIGPKVDPKLRNYLKYDELYDLFKKINPTGKEIVSIANYPIVIIEKNDNLKFSKDGTVTLEPKKFYHLTVSVHQAENDRDRSVRINSEKGVEFKGKDPKSKDIDFGDFQGSKKEAYISVKFDTLEYYISLYVHISEPWYKRKIFSLVILLVLSIGLIWFYDYKFAVNIKDNATVFIPVALLCIKSVIDWFVPD